MEKRKFNVCVSGNVLVTVMAESEWQAEAMVEAVRSHESMPSEFGVSENDAIALGQMRDYIIDVYEAI